MSPSPVDTKDSTISSLKSELTLAGHELGSDLVDREKSDNLDLHVYPKRGRALVLLFIFALSVGIDGELVMVESREVIIADYFQC
jgi:hypothetical protein